MRNLKANARLYHCFNSQNPFFNNTSCFVLANNSDDAKTEARFFIGASHMVCQFVALAHVQRVSHLDFGVILVKKSRNLKGVHIEILDEYAQRATLSAALYNQIFSDN